MDFAAKLDEISAYLRAARAMPMSASCIVNRTELLDHVEELRQLLPTELTAAERLMQDRQDVIAEGRREAERIVRAAREERSRLVAKADVVQEAVREADRTLAAAKADADRMRAEVDDYVDTKLANFEVALHKTLRAVERGRSKLHGRTGLEDLGVDRPALSR